MSRGEVYQLRDVSVRYGTPVMLLPELRAYKRIRSVLRYCVCPWSTATISDTTVVGTRS